MKAKKNRFLSALLSVVMLTTVSVTGAFANETEETTALTAKHYPGVAKVLPATEGDGGTLYWKPAEAGEITSTTLYQLSGSTWGKAVDVTGAKSAAIDDVNALYKLETVFADGAKSEYVIQANDSGTKATVLNPIGTWHGTTKNYYVGVTGADSHSGERALRAHTWDGSANNRFWVRLIDKPATFTKDQNYRLSFWYRTDYNYGLSLRIDGYEINGTNNSSATVPEWKQYTRNFTGSGNTNDVYAFGLNLSWCNDAWIDDIEIYALDADGNPTGSNLIADGTFESPRADGTIPFSGVFNIGYEGIANGAVLNWQQAESAIGTRVYDADGNLIAELGSATELPITGLTDGESYTYELRGVSAGGYESIGKTVTVTAGSKEPQKPEIKAYYPINLTARSYDDGENGARVRVFWINPDLDNATLTGIKIYNISGDAPVEKSAVEDLNLESGYENIIYIADSQDELNDKFRFDFTYDDNTSVSFTTQVSAIQWGIKDNWSLQSSARGMLAYGQETNYSHSGSGSLVMDRYAWLGQDFILYEGDKTVFEAGKEYEVSFWYKTIQARNSESNERYAYLRFLGNDIKFACDDTYDWTKVTKRVTATSNTTIGLYLETRSAVWVDDISVKLVENGTVVGDELFVNGTFDDVQSMSQIYDATYTGTDGGVILNWTRTDNSIYGTNVYVDGVRVAEVYDVASTLPLYGLENGKNYVVALKDVNRSGMEYNGAYLTVTAGKGNGTDLYKADGIVVKETTAGNNIAWYNPWVAPSAISFYDVTAGKEVSVKNAVVLNANGEETAAGTPAMSLAAGKYNYVTVDGSKGVTGHVYQLTFTFADGQKRDFYTNASTICSDRVTAWQNAYGNKEITHFAYTDDAIGERAFAYGRYYWNYGSANTASILYNRALAGKLEAGKTYRVAYKLKGKELSGGNSISLEGNAGAKIEAKPSKNFLQYYTDITVASLGNTNTYISVNGAPYMVLDDFEVYELDANKIPVKEIEVWNGDFEEDHHVDAVTDVKAEAGGSKVKLSWTLPAIPEGNWDASQKAALTAIGANVYLNGVQIAKLNQANSLEVTGLTPGAEYSFEIKAINVVGFESEGVTVKAKLDADLIAASFDIYDAAGDSVDSIGGFFPEYSVAAKLNNLTDESKDVMIAFAMYDENNRLLFVLPNTQPIASGAENAPISVDYTTEDLYLPDEVSYAKIFLWNMTDGMKPMGESNPIPRQD